MRFTSDKWYTEEEDVKIHLGLFVNDMMYRKYVSIHNEETCNQETELYLKQNDKISLVTILETRLPDDEKFGKELFNAKLSGVSFDLFTDIIS